MCYTPRRLPAANMISSTVWVQRGAMQPKPARHEVGPEELEMMRRLARCAVPSSAPAPLLELRGARGAQVS